MNDMYPRKTGRLGPQRVGRVMPGALQKAAGSSVSGLAPSSAPESDTKSGKDGSGDLRAHIRAAINHWHMRYDPVDDEGEPLDAAIAAALLQIGFRRVSVDDDTVERVARAIHDIGCGSDNLCKGYDTHGEWDRRLRDDSYESEARAAVQVLRGGGND